MTITHLHANPLLTGTYVGNIIYNGSPFTYRITFKSASICSLQAVSTVSGREMTQEAEATYSCDDNFFRLNAIFRDYHIPAINSV